MSRIIITAEAQPLIRGREGSNVCLDNLSCDVSSYKHHPVTCPSLPAHSIRGDNMEAVAKFDFNASGEDELSFQAGDVLKVSVTQDPTKAFFV